MGTFELRDYLQPLRRWWWLLVTATLIAVVASFLYSASQPAVYQSRATLMVGADMRNPNPNGGEFYMAQQLAGIYADVANSGRVREATLKALGFDWLPYYDISHPLNSQVIQVQVFDQDPQRAFVVATELVKQIILLGPAGQEEQIEQAFVAEQLDKMRTSIKETENEISKQENNLLTINSARELANQQAEIGALQAKLNTLRTNYTSLLATTQRGAINAIQVLDPAYLPTEPMDSGLFSAMLAAAALGFTLAAGGAYLIECLDNSVKSVAEIKTGLKLTLLGTVPEISEVSRDSDGRLVMLNNVASLAVEAYRGLRTNLQFASVDEPLRQILVTSSQAEEGKSLTAANLAVALARSGKTVILVDADLHRPTQHRLFKLINNVGLTTALLSHYTCPDELLQPTIVPGLSVLTSGPLPPNPAELLGSRRMHELLEVLKQAAEVVIVDSPPVTAVVDAAVLSAVVDGVLLVIRSERTSRDTVKQAIDALQQVKAHLLGAVFNRVAAQKSAYYHSKGYGYYQSAHWRAVKLPIDNGEPQARMSAARSPDTDPLSTDDPPQDAQAAHRTNGQSASTPEYNHRPLRKRYSFRAN